MSDLEQRATQEAERLTALLFDCGVEKNRVELLETLIDNTAWMKAKLDDAREAVKNSQIVIAYDNGGNQKGIRINPLFTGYEALWKSYMQGMSKIVECLPQEQIKQEAETERSEVEASCLIYAAFWWENICKMRLRKRSKRR